MEDICLGAPFQKAIWEIITRFFMFPRHKLLVVRKLLVKMIVAMTFSMGLEARRQIELSGSSKTYIDFTGFRMFEDKDFLKDWAMYMKSVGYPLTKEMMDQMALLGCWTQWYVCR
jgi:hypothetical protein